MGLKPRAVVVIDIKSGRVVKRYASMTEAKEEEFCRYETIRDRCNHKADESRDYRTFRWAEEVDLE